MLVYLPEPTIHKLKEWGSEEDFNFLVSLAIQTFAPSSLAPSNPLIRVKINLSKEDELTLRKRSVMIGETVDSLLAQLLENYV